ncbi:uncharacterized protein At5g41620-like isoform X2 [Diospyros lotus]|uniref:uncharacterized protein At5g41620-like isoform X2 n=1 Tax=Diospyros lotus TaxID=55363 RepID=UPI00224CC659|nr:uncharacterized protein At5g41620-like isoform X2 [Diospyros lotus]
MLKLHSLDVEGRVEKRCKVRKRGCSSSSSTSLVRSYRLKRAILVRKRGGSSTPVPTWKMGSRSPPGVLQNAKASKHHTPSQDLSVSARKLAATLWEISEVTNASPKMEESGEGRSDMDARTRERMVKVLKSSSMMPNTCDPTHSLVEGKMDRSKAGGHRRRSSVIPQLGGLDSIRNASTAEMETQFHDQIPSGYVIGVKARLRDVSNGLAASKELLKVLNRIWVREEQHSSSMTLVSALRFELDRARMQVDQLILEQRSNCYEIDYLLKQFAEEKAAWRSKERDRIRSAISSIAAELKVEKKLRRQTERLNKKLGRELADTKASLSKAVKELESEKRAKEILEQVCDELARGIGEDRAEVEEMKRESAKVHEEMEKERQMLQLADVLREERVQMKLSEAKYEFEEKNAVVEKLKSELEACLRTKIDKEKYNGSPNFNRIKELEQYLRATLGASHQNGQREHDEGGVMDGEEHEGDDSADSDLHSIELNMDNISKSYNWSYTFGDATQNDSKRSSVDEKRKGRRSSSQRSQRTRTSLERKISDGMEWEFGTNGQGNADGFDRRRLSELASESWRKDYEDEIERYQMVRDLREHILSGARITSSQGFASPDSQIDLSLPSQDPASVACNG